MEKPEFVYGSEKRFGDFVKSLENAKKIISVSHTDLDGIASAKVVNYALEADEVLIVNYHEMDEGFIDKLKKEKPSHIIFTDLFIKKEFISKVEKFAQVLVIDHHVPEGDFNSDKTTFLCAPGSGMCAAYISYYLFSKIKDLGKIDWIVACASISDYCYFKNQEWMSEVYSKHGDNFIAGIWGNEMSGKFWDLQWKISLALVYFVDNPKRVYEELGMGFGDIGNLNKYVEEVQKDFDNSLKNFKKERIVFKEGYWWEVDSKFAIKGMLINYLSTLEPGKTLVFARTDNGVYHFSARRQDGKENMIELLKKLVEGLKEADAGGHFKAAGGHVLAEEREKVLERVRKL